MSGSSRRKHSLRSGGISSEQTRFYYVISALDQQTADRLIDFLESPPTTNPCSRQPQAICIDGRNAGSARRPPAMSAFRASVPGTCLRSSACSCTMLISPTRAPTPCGKPPETSHHDQPQLVFLLQHFWHQHTQVPSAVQVFGKRASRPHCPPLHLGLQVQLAFPH